MRAGIPFTLERLHDRGADAVGPAIVARPVLATFEYEDTFEYEEEAACLPRTRSPPVP